MWVAASTTIRRSPGRGKCAQWDGWSTGAGRPSWNVAILLLRGPVVASVSANRARPRGRIAQPRRTPYEDDMTQEETLDPRDWAALRALGHRALDDAMD